MDDMELPCVAELSTNEVVGDLPADGTDDLVGADQVDGAMPPSLADEDSLDIMDKNVGGDPVLCGAVGLDQLFDVYGRLNMMKFSLILRRLRTRI